MKQNETTNNERRAPEEREKKQKLNLQMHQISHRQVQNDELLEMILPIYNVRMIFK